MRHISIWRGIGIAAACSVAVLVAAEVTRGVTPQREIHSCLAVGLILYLLLLARSVTPPRRVAGIAGLVVLTVLMASLSGALVSLAFVGILFLGRSLLLAENLTDIALELVVTCAVLVFGIWAAGSGGAAVVWCIGVLLAGTPLMRGRELNAATVPTRSFDASCAAAEKALERLVRQRG
jgi:hypothetical protein